ncbi:GbsR/MarR family transcriptional regulator [Agaribacterium haliotis]|uniref:GbsR/MarR family transcriptional regulator n=1 Tax=Agaribacterium haliotis TaxID=2013869 RepID=UPI000BB5757A|nr:MarR family transcriptional regulator [Agaribacterium haliotis]
MQLSSHAQAFVTHFGEMGSRWGFNRTVGQMLALIVISPEPSSADEVSQKLGISRGNVSMGIKELQSWRLIKVHKVAGDRKDYYQAAGSIWDMARMVFEERSRRELVPTLSLLRSQLIEPSQDLNDAFAHEKMAEIYELLELANDWSNAVSGLSQKQLQSLMTLGSGLGKLIELKDKALGSSKT